MRRLSALALIAALGAAFVVSTVHAQPAVIPQWMRNNVRVTVQQGADGFPVVEQYPASSFAIFKPNWLNTVLAGRIQGGPPPSPCVMQDSTSAEDVRGANWLALFIYPTVDDSVAAALVALQFRWHFTNGAVDSSTSFIEQGTRTFPMTQAAAGGPTNAAVRDSIGSLTYIPATAGGISRYSVGAAAVANTDSLATPDEQVLVITNVSGVNRGRMIRVRVPDGLSANSAGLYFSLRARYMNSYNASGIAYGNGGGGASSAAEPLYTAGAVAGTVRLNIALVGGR